MKVFWLLLKKKKERQSKELGVFFSPEGFSCSQRLIRKLKNYKVTQKFKAHNRILYNVAILKYNAFCLLREPLM